MSDALLAGVVKGLDEIESARIAAQNRARAFAGLGFDGHPTHTLQVSIAEELLAIEKRLVREVEREMRKHPLGPTVANMQGVGLRQAARLLAALGDPGERPNVAKLWQYAGHGDPARSHCRRGCPVEHSPIAKMRTHLIAKQCIKYVGEANRARSPYRDVYDRERAKWAGRDVSDGHKHNHALRVVGKTILRDLWVAAREVPA